MPSRMRAEKSCVVVFSAQRFIADGEMRRSCVLLRHKKLPDKFVTAYYTAPLEFGCLSLVYRERFPFASQQAQLHLGNPPTLMPTKISLILGSRLVGELFFRKLNALGELIVWPHRKVIDMQLGNRDWASGVMLDTVVA